MTAGLGCGCITLWLQRSCHGCMVADGMNTEEILKAYPDLRLEDIREGLQYAAEAVRERELPLITPA